MIDSIFAELEQKMDKTIQSLKKEFTSIRTGRANPAMLDRIEVEYYGSMTGLKQLGNVTTPDSRTILIQPYDRGVMAAIEKAIQKSDLGITPNNDGQYIRLSIPQPTEQRRKELVKIARKVGEEAKVAIRNERRTAVDKIKKLEKDSALSEDESKKAQDKVQKATDKHTADIDKLAEAKEKEILEI